MKTKKQDKELLKLGKKLIGSWRVSGDAKGKIKFRWLHEGTFLIQDFDLTVFGRRVEGVEIIGRLKRPNQEVSQEIWSRAYIFTGGETFDYVYELKDRGIVIWFGGLGSANKFQGTFAADGKSYAGAWSWPGGGYKIEAKKVSKQSPGRR